MPIPSTNGYIDASEASKKLKDLCPIVNIANHIVNIWDIHWVKYSPKKNYYHTQDILEIHVPFAGEGIVRAGGKSRRFSPGQFTLNLPGTRHMWEPTKSSLEMQVWWFLIQERKRIEDDDAVVDDLFSFFSTADQLVYDLPPLYYALFDHICNEFKRFSPRAEFIIKTLMKSVILLFAESIANAHSIQPRAPSPTAASGVQKSDATIVAEVDGLISDYLHENFSLEEIASRLRLAPRSLTRRYKKQKGQTIWRTVMEMRLECAKSLLEQTTLSIADVAARSGFRSKNYFTKRFKQHLAISPSDYRRSQI